MTPIVLLVDHEESTLDFLSEELMADGFAVAPARSTEAACEMADAVAPDLILLGELPSWAEAVAFLDAIRAGGDPFDAETAVVVLSRAGNGVDALRAFEHGADDVVSRSVAYPELRARVHAVLRRHQSRRPSEVLGVAELQIDTRSRVVLVAGQPVSLTPKEFNLLVRLAQEPGRVFAKAELTRELWGYPQDSRTRTLDSHACRLRRKLGVNSERRWIHNVWGVGYALIDASSDDHRVARRARRALGSAVSDWLPRASVPSVVRGTATF